MLHPPAVLQAAEPVSVVRPAIGDLGGGLTELYSGEDSGWQEAGALAPRCCWWLLSWAVWCVCWTGRRHPARWGIVGGLRAGGGATGRLPEAGPGWRWCWADVGPEGPWEGPEEVVEGRALLPGAWGWLEELARDRAHPGLPGSCVPAAVVATTA